MRPVRLLSALAPGLGPATGYYLGAGFAIAVVVVASRTLSRRTGLPYPVFLVVAGAAAGFLPHMGRIALDPQVVFLGFLPPLVFHAGLLTSPRELRANALPIALGAFGLVLATTFAVAGVAVGVVPSLGWAGAVVLGAIVAPTDPVAATSVMARLSAPPGVTTILEGESLVNDGIALALFSLGLAALAAPTSPAAGLVSFLRIAGGGTAFGIAVGVAAGRLQRVLRDASSRTVVSLIIPFAAYLPADALGLSGVLATLAAGLVVGPRATAGLEPAGRIRIADFWQVLVFLLESVLFVLVGLQLRRLVDGLRPDEVGSVALLAGSAVATVVVLRLVWWLAVPTIRWRPEGRLLDTGSMPRRERLVLGWSGLRGAISLAAALSVPASVSGHSFPGRDLVVFTTFCVIVATLVGQGTTLGWLLKRLGVVGSELEGRQRAMAERRCAEAALRLLDRLVAEEQVGDETAEWLRERYERRLARARLLAGDDEEEDTTPARLPGLERRLLGVQVQTLQQLHRQGEITNGVMRVVRRELDLEHARFQG